MLWKTNHTKKKNEELLHVEEETPSGDNFPYILFSILLLKKRILNQHQHGDETEYIFNPFTFPLNEPTRDAKRRRKK